MKWKMRRNVRARVERKCHPPVWAKSMEWTKEAESVRTWRSAWTPHWLLVFSDQFPHPDIGVMIWKNSVGLT